jgi:hypothetical protein
MCAQSVESILSRAMKDATFAELLFSDADKALSGYDLTAEEIGNLKAMPRADFDQAHGGSPEERKSFGVQLNHIETALRIR